VTSHALDPASPVTNGHTSSNPPSSVTYFVDGPQGCGPKKRSGRSALTDKSGWTAGPRYCRKKYCQKYTVNFYGYNYNS